MIQHLMFRSKRIAVLFCTVLLFLVNSSATAQTKTIRADVVIYGGTSTAIATAVQLKRMNKSVVIVCPEKHLGGLSASGLGFTDIGNKNVIGGISREFYQQVYQHYQKKDAWKWQAKSNFSNEGQGTTAIDDSSKTMWTFEPHVAEAIFERFIKDNNINVYRNKWLDREKGVKMKGGAIVSIAMLSGETFAAKIFVDATYEGDLMAAAGVKYHVGREANSVYNETWNGVQKGVFHHGHNFGNRKISPYVIPGDASSGVLKRISTDPPGEQGKGDDKVQAYNYRLCTTNAEGNVVPFERPGNYDSTQYELLRRVFASGWTGMFGGGKIPNNKRDVNNVGPFSSDNIGMNYDYPEASYARRKEILDEHIAYHKGLLYFGDTTKVYPRIYETT